MKEAHEVRQLPITWFPAVPQWQNYSDVWGNRLYLDVGRVNGKQMTLIYNHISSYKARTGDRVGRGEVVAYSGTTGWSTGCHLHFTVLIDGKAVNPQNYM